VVAAVLSSNEDKPIDTKSCFAAEVGLSGEIRPVTRIEPRILEAEKLGFKQIFVSYYNLKGINSKKFKIDVRTVKKIEDLWVALFR